MNEENQYKNIKENIIVGSILLLAMIAFIALMTFFVFMTSNPPEANPMQYERAWDIWAPRLLAFAILFNLLFVAPLGGVYIKWVDKRYRHVEKLEMIKRTAEAKQPKIVMNKAKKTIDNTKVQIGNILIDKVLLSSFVRNVISVGLEQDNWESDFTDYELDAIYTHMEKVGLITDGDTEEPQWARSIDTMRLLKYFPLEEEDIAK
jgi:hypothetical protein